MALCQQLVHSVAGEGDEVVFAWRSFEAYPIVTQIAGAKAVRVPVTATHELDLPAIAEAIGSATRLVFVCTPNNPTGTAIRRDELVEFLDEVPTDVLVVIDEAYREFDTAKDSPDGLEFAMSRPNVVALRTLSKAYGLAGLRVGYAVGDPDGDHHDAEGGDPVRAQLARADGGDRGARRQGRAGAALAAGRRRASRVFDELEALGFEVPPSQANFVWLPLRERAADFAAHCDANGVIVRAFPDASGGVRVTIGAAHENDAFLAAARTFPL